MTKRQVFDYKSIGYHEAEDYSSFFKDFKFCLLYDVMNAIPEYFGY